MKVRQITLHTIDLETRMPFRFGIATLTRVRHCFLSLEAEIDGRLCHGLAADHLFPKWFKKDPEQTFEAEVAELTEVVTRAAQFALEIETGTLFDFWKVLYDRQLSWGNWRGMEPLLALFGTTLVERALLDALARRHASTAAELILENRLGIDLGLIEPGLAGAAPADLLPAAPLPSVRARHTVGLTDPLTDAEIAPDDRLQDGLPQSLEACVEAYGLSHFKIKVCGDLERDIPRLKALRRILEERAPDDYAFSLDGNEQFRSCGDFRAFWDTVSADPDLRALFRHALFIEQPLQRAVALSESVREIGSWQDLPPIIIDESDAELGSTPRALELGYAGTSHKNCKGIIRGLLNRCLINDRANQGDRERFLMSGEDLVNIGPVALLQDLAMQSILGNESVERNGHHYFAGLSAFPQATAEALLAAHPDLYRRTADGWPTLRIQEGRLSLESILKAPFACGFDLPTADYREIPIPTATPTL